MADPTPTPPDDPTNIDQVNDKDREDIWNNRRRMAWLSLWGIIAPTIFIILHIHDPNTIDKIGVMMSWYYLSLASIVGAYFGFRAWASIKGLGGKD